MRGRRIIRAGGLAAAVTMAGLGGYLTYLHASGNFHPVVVNELYRSAQVSDGDLADSWPPADTSMAARDPFA